MRALNSIRARVTAGFTAAVALLMLSTCGLVLAFARARAENEKANALRSATRDFVMEVGKGGRKAALAEMDLQDADLRSRGILLVLRDSRGKEIAEVGSHRHSSRPTVTVRARTVWVGADTAVFSLSWAEERRNLARQAAELGVVAVVVILAAGLGAWVLVGRTLSPISALSRQANLATAETLSVRLEPPSDDAEVVQLVRTLNGLLARLSEAAASRGRFYAAASHELRTPLQALLGHLELGSARQRTPEEYRAILDEASRQADRLIVLTRDLLFLNRLESGTAEAAPEPVDLMDVAERAIAHTRDAACRRGLAVSLDGPGSVLVTAPPSHAEMMVRNLVENAVKYTPDGGAVRVRLADAPARLEVLNDVDGPEEKDPERLFEPFYRPDGSRNSETGGNGLGLAICKAIAEADGWSIVLRTPPQAFHAEVIADSAADDIR